MTALPRGSSGQGLVGLPPGKPEGVKQQPGCTSGCQRWGGGGDGGVEGWGGGGPSPWRWGEEGCELGLSPPLPVPALRGSFRGLSWTFLELGAGSVCCFLKAYPNSGGSRCPQRGSQSLAQCWGGHRNGGLFICT